MDTRKKILVVDDEGGMLRALEYALTKEGFEPVTARNGVEALRKLSYSQPDLVLLDIMMPEIDGWEACRRMREVSDVPIIMLTARVGEGDIVRGLDMGADDYVTKPFRMAELLARVRSALRRASLVASSTGQGQLSYDGGQLIVDMDRRVVIFKGEVKTLSSTEFRLLSYLIANAGRVLSHEQLLERVWGAEYIDETDYLKVYIRSLRAKIEEDTREPRYILVRRGLGYYFNARPEF